MIKFHKKRRERGQTLILIMVALPLFFALMALVVDGGNVLVHKRNIQNAADAAALAIAQNIDHASNPPTCGTYSGQSGNAACNTLAAEYSSKNGVNTSMHRCSDADPTNPTDTNCWAYPYVDTSNVTHQDEVEVRLRAPVATFFVGAVNAMLNGGLSTTFNVSARAVAQTDQVLGVTTIPGQTFTGSTTVLPGGTHTTTDPDQLSGGSGVAFTMSRVCNSISYTGAGSGTQVLGAFATNGGVFFNGNAPKKMTWLASNRNGCPNNPPSPPSGTNQCTSTDPSWGDATDSNNLCVKTLVNLNGPINWPITPPTPPTPRSGTWNASTDFGTNCIDLGNGNVTFSTTNHLPGVYCVTGAGASLSFSNVGDLTTGDGYTFFALGGATISLSGNSNMLKFYWPSACGAGTRPTVRASSYPCPGLGKTISGYDAFTLLYATYPSADGACAICLQGQSNELTGDMFATRPDVFPPLPGLTQVGGLVKINGGALSAGQGFIESWNLAIAGNTGSYRGTGTSLVIPGQTHTTTDPSTTIIIPSSTGAATTVATTLGTTLDLSQ